MPASFLKDEGLIVFPGPSSCIFDGAKGLLIELSSEVASLLGGRLEGEADRSGKGRTTSDTSNVGFEVERA